MTNCEKVMQILPEYIGKSTTKHQNAEIALHISLCPECMSDLAFWLSVNRAAKTKELPNFAVMFDKLPKKRTELQKILDSGSPGMAFDVVRYVFSIINETYRLASLENQ